MSRDVSLGLLAAGLVFLMAACAVPPSAERQAWLGTTTADADTHTLAIDVTLTPTGAWSGTYTVERTPAFTGDVDGTLVDGNLQATLTVSPACRFELAGTVTGSSLDATFAPTECDGGSGGVWSATRTTPAPAADATSPIPSDDATFDGGASFDAAGFR